jgi:AhpD family alkylhydroperoxidase
MTTTDARIPLLEREQVPPQVAQLYDTLLATRGVVPNMFKALSNLPPLVLAIAEFLKPIMGEGALPGWYKELVATLVASLNRCDYCVSAHTHLALQRGATPLQVESLSAFETGPFTEKEKAGFRYAGLLHISGHAIDEPAYAAVSVHYNPQELLELTALAAAFEFFSRVNTSLRIPVTQIPSRNSQWVFNPRDVR